MFEWRGIDIPSSTRVSLTRVQLFVASHSFLASAGSLSVPAESAGICQCSLERFQDIHAPMSNSKFIFFFHVTGLFLLAAKGSRARIEGHTGEPGFFVGGECQTHEPEFFVVLRVRACLVRSGLVARLSVAALEPTMGERQTLSPAAGFRPVRRRPAARLLSSQENVDLTRVKRDVTLTARTS